MSRAVRPAVRADVEVVPVRGRRDRRRFLKLPWRIYRGDPAWVPPLLSEQRQLLDPEHHPFHRHAEVECFLAVSAGEVLGRIAAIVNRRHLEFHREPVGFFGFFECVDDPAVAGSLLGRAEAWLRDRGMERVRGPMSPSTNETCGLLVDGFGVPPVVMMPYNPPYYERLLQSAGYAAVKDLLAYLLDDPRVPERFLRAERRLRRDDLVIRPVDMARFGEEVEKIREVYNSAWERNWGFVPMTDEEFDYMARQLKPVVDPRVCLLAESDGEPVGFSLALPDYNIALRHMNGRLFPFGLLKLLWYRRRIDAVRVITLGLKPGHRRRGIDALLYLRTYIDGTAAGYYRAECSWILDDNWPMRRALERMGGRVYKTYRIFETAL